jgi:uncharacterized protein YneF (UPF0154 family)
MNKKFLIILIYLISGFLFAGAFLSLRIYNSLEDNLPVNKEIIKSFFFKSLIQSYIVILFPFVYIFYKNLKSNNN